MNKGQKEIDKWYKKSKWPYWKPEWILARLVEEVGEFARMVNHEFGPKKKKATENKQELEDEFGDILYTLACFGNSNGIDMDTALKKSIHKAHNRDKNRF